MAKEIARRKKVRHGKSAGNKEALADSKFKKRGDKAAAKSAARKQLKKTAKNGADRAKARPAYAADYGLMTAFHHMQRASVVMSLMEEGTGEDLRKLLKRGVKLYRKAVEDSAKNKFVLQ